MGNTNNTSCHSQEKSKRSCCCSADTIVIPEKTVEEEKKIIVQEFDQLILNFEICYFLNYYFENCSKLSKGDSLLKIFISETPSFVLLRPTSDSFYIDYKNSYHVKYIFDSEFLKRYRKYLNFSSSINILLNINKNDKFIALDKILKEHQINTYDSLHEKYIDVLEPLIKRFPIVIHSIIVTYILDDKKTLNNVKWSTW